MKLLLQNKNYMYLLWGYTFSILVDSIVFMMCLKIVEVLSNNTTSYTFLYIFHYIPAVLFSLWIGAWINSKKLEKVMITSLIVRIAILLTFLFADGLNNLSMVYLFIFIESFISIFFFPSTDTLVTKIVNKEQRLMANGFIKLLYVLMQGMGFGISTILIKMNISLVFILGICLIALVIATFFISKINKHYEITLQKQNIVKEVLDTMRYLQQHKLTSKIFILFAIAWLVASSIDLIVISYLTNVSKVSSDNFGIVAIIVFVGMILGAHLSSYLYDKINVKYIFSFPLLVYSVTVLSMYFFQQWTYTLPFFLLGGFSLGFFEVCFTTFLQDYNDEQYYTRIFSFQNMILSSMPLPGMLFLGVFIEWSGIKLTIIIVSFLLFVVSIFAYLTNYKQVNDQEIKDIV
ncbi:MFS transporter [Priestia megaterium]|uniref:MFS transporter n=1 Tax=Priestia megaterium TaxID=1404 RepID=UPI003242DFF3